MKSAFLFRRFLNSSELEFTPTKEYNVRNTVPAMSRKRQSTAQQPEFQWRQSGRAQTLHPNARAMHDERVRRVKNKPLFKLGGTMPDRSDQGEYTGEPSGFNASASSTRDLDAVADHIYSRMANKPGYKSTKPSRKVPRKAPRQAPPPPCRQNTIGRTGGQIGGVINDAADTGDAPNRDHGKPDNESQEPSYYKAMADTEMQDEHQKPENSQGDENKTGQIGGQMHNQWLNTPETQAKFDDPKEPIFSWWFIVRENFREPLAEFIASMVFIIIGLGASVQSYILPSGSTNLYWSWGIAVMTGVYISGGVSGGHLNPALTLALAVFRGFPWKMVWQFWVAQLVGMFCGGLLVYAIYSQALTTLDPDKTVSASGSSALFVTYPSSLSSIGLSVFQNIINTAILTITVLSLGDRDNSPPGASLGAFILALVIMALGSSLGALSGYPMNPSRDLGPRFALSCVGYGRELWTEPRWWLGGPILGSFAGAVLGGVCYDFFIYSGLGSPLNFTTKQWKRLIVNNMAKPGIDRQKRDNKASRKQHSKDDDFIVKGYKAV
ncbi:hypothetical protein E3P84_02737 [Wallemia ichthyophaga]|nr:hypothetical protein E3P84_02737 [Wallemia ichthyophaga]TIB40724.1 hypothetical protein E3P83_02674 [Wallemia ichthyophaga]